MSPPAFPVLASELQGSWSFGSIDEGVHTIEGFTVLAREIPHKGGRTMGYRVSDAWSSLAYLSDHGPAMDGGPGPDGFGPYHDAAMDLCRGVDLLIHDAQYTASELPFRIHYGHSAANYAVALARLCGVGRVLLFHHDPERTDTEVAAIERAMRVGEDIAVDAAREGTTILLGASRSERSDVTAKHIRRHRRGVRPERPGRGVAPCRGRSFGAGAGSGRRDRRRHTLGGTDAAWLHARCLRGGPLARSVLAGAVARDAWRNTGFDGSGRRSRWRIRWTAVAPPCCIERSTKQRRVSAQTARGGSG